MAGRNNENQINVVRFGFGCDETTVHQDAAHQAGGTDLGEKTLKPGE